MKVRKAIIWSLVNNKPHKSMTDEEKRINGMMPLVEALFPGINYYSISGFHQVLNECVIPALKKQFPELLTASAEAIKPEETVKIAKLLPSKGYEWQDSLRWKSKFQRLLAA